GGQNARRIGERLTQTRPEHRGGRPRCSGPRNSRSTELTRRAFRCSVFSMNEDQPPAPNWRTNAMVARFVGIVAIALGFILGMYGLDEQGSRWLQTALGLLVTG